MTNNDNKSNSNDSSKEVQVACSPRLKRRQAFTEFLAQMMRDREKELVSLSERHSVSKFMHRGRIQSTLRVRCYKTCIAIQDRCRCISSDLNRVPQGSGVMHLLREVCKTNSENIETGASSSSVSSWGRILDKDPHKATENKVLQGTIEKSDLRETRVVISAVENAKKAVLSETVENKSGFKKSAGKAIQKKTFNKQKRIKKKKFQLETAEGRGEKRDTKEEAVSKESLEGLGQKQELTKENPLIGIAEKVNLRNSKKKKNRRRVMEKGKGKTDNKEINEVLKDASERISNVETSERSIASSKETVGKEEMMDRKEIKRETTRRESAEKGGIKKEEDFDSVEPKSKEFIEDKNMNPQEEKSTSHGYRVRSKEMNLSQHGEEMWILRNGEAIFTNEIDRNNWEEEEEEEKYGDYDVYNGENMDKWIHDISWPPIYRKDLRKESYFGVLNTESEKGIMRFGDLMNDQSIQETQVISDLRGQIEQVQREMLELRNSFKSCIDMQLHFQKSITQDLSRSEQRVDMNKDPLKRKCYVCSEMPIDSVFYRCGHICTCLKCAHELQWSSMKCPICIAPIVVVVRVFLVS